MESVLIIEAITTVEVEFDFASAMEDFEPDFSADLGFTWEIPRKVETEVLGNARFDWSHSCRVIEDSQIAISVEINQQWEEVSIELLREVEIVNFFSIFSRTDRTIIGAR